MCHTSYQFRVQLISGATRFKKRCASIPQQDLSISLISRIARSTGVKDHHQHHQHHHHNNNERRRK
jgi:hypothetical protein